MLGWTYETPSIIGVVEIVFNTKGISIPLRKGHEYAKKSCTQRDNIHEKNVLKVFTSSFELVDSISLPVGFYI